MSEQNIKKASLSLVIPLYNEVDSIAILLKAIKEVTLPHHFELKEIFVIDDGSTDGSSAVVREEMLNNPKIHLLEFERNFGQTSALQAGFRNATSDIIVTLDADLQNDPNDIPLLLEKVDEGYDVVSGWRKNRKDAFLRTQLSKVANKIISISTGVALNDYGCTLKAYRKSHLDKIHLYGEMHRFIPIYMNAVGSKIKEVVVNHRSRLYGESKYGLNRTFKVVLDLMVIRFLNKYSNRPIYLFGAMGFASLFISFLSMFYGLYLKFFADTAFIETPLPIIFFTTFFMGMNFIFLGLLAELLMRVYYESQNKATYLIKDKRENP